MTVSRFHIQRMDCAAEEQLVRMALSDVTGVRRIEVDLDQRDVLVAHDGDVSQIDRALAALDLGSSQVAEAGPFSDPADPRKERGALIFAFIVNVGFFVGELTFGLLSNSMGLIADALDMGADATVYALSLAAVGTAAAHKKRYARLSGYLQFGLAMLGVVEVLRRFLSGEEPPDPTTMVLLSLLALAGNVAVLLVLQRVRSGEVHLEASWIFTANDIKVNLLVIAAAIGVSVTGSAIPDLLAGGIIFAVVANGARRILRISR
ncbi:MAG: cation transporter [Candidatus Nanopelagicales bacterium]